MTLMIFKYTLAVILGILISLYILLQPVQTDVESLWSFNEIETIALLGGSFLFGTLFFLLLSRLKLSLFIGLVDIGATAIGMSITFLPLLSMAGLNYPISFLFAAIVAAVVNFSRDSRLRNMAALLASAGIGALLGSMVSYWVAIGLGVLLIIYDYIAVKKTGHMIELAKMIAENKMSMMVTSNEMIRGEESTMVLGTGDIAFPTSVACSLFQVSVALPFVFLIGCIFGLFLLFNKLNKDEYAPALPYLIIPGMVAVLIYHISTSFLT